MKNAFCFTLKTFFVLKIFTYLFWLCGHVENGSIKKINFKIHDVPTWLTNNCDTHNVQYLTK